MPCGSLGLPKLPEPLSHFLLSLLFSFLHRAHLAHLHLPSSAYVIFLTDAAVEIFVPTPPVMPKPEMTKGPSVFFSDNVSRRDHIGIINDDLRLHICEFVMANKC